MDQSQIGSCREPSVDRKFTFGEYRKQVQEDVERTGRKVGWSSSAFHEEEERSSRSSRTRMSDLFRDEREGAEMYRAGVSTRLELYRDPWKIKKKVTASDIGNSSRLLIPRSCVETHVLPLMGPEMVRQVESSNDLNVAVWDADTADEYQLVFRYWATSESYVLKGGWNKLFVKRRGLQVGDEIGMLWLPLDTKPMFIFKLLQKAGPRTSNAATWSSH